MEFVHPDGLDYVRQQLVSQRYVEDGLADFEYRIFLADQLFHWVRVRTFPIRSHEGAILRRAGILEDIKERQQTENALREQHEVLHLGINKLTELYTG